MVQDKSGSRHPAGSGSGGENGPETSQVDDERLSFNAEGSLHRTPAECPHDWPLFTQAPRAAINRRFSFAVLMATRIICAVRPGTAEQSRTSSLAAASRSVTSLAQVVAGSSISKKFAEDG
jgi:hypothetical protein